MNEVLMMIVILLPIFGGILVRMLPFAKRWHMLVYVETIVVINTIIVLLFLANPPEEAFVLFRFTGDLSISFKLDGLGTVFAAIVAVLWPLASLFAFEYMEHEKNEKTFYTFYTITYGVTLGIALAEDILTMYFFYEMLTMVTLPLIIHSLNREAVLATRTYLYYSLGGAAFAFLGMVFIWAYGFTLNFTPGGVLDPGLILKKINLLLIIYVMCFCGFSVKAAMWPFSKWLPKAGVAPTPVTALLHAVAVVKAGAFATIRVTYYSFGVDLLRGTWAQDLLMIMVMFTIVYGCSRALKETHIKRRLAWSTVSNLSYILFGVVLMSPMGLVGATSHMIFHAVMKICAFFCAGAIMHKTGCNYIHELDGMGRKMPGVFIIFTISGLALMGVPGLCGFISKWNLAQAAVEAGTPLAYVGIAALLISALLTAIYMMTIVVRAFFPGRDFNYASLSHVKDPGWKMLLPLGIFAVAIWIFGLYSEPVIQYLETIAASFI